MNVHDTTTSVATALTITYAATSKHEAKREPIGKTWAAAGVWPMTSGVQRKAYHYEIAAYSDLGEVRTDLLRRIRAGTWSIISGAPRPELKPGSLYARIKEHFHDVPNRLLVLDFDGLTPDPGEDISKPEHFSGDVVVDTLCARLEAAGVHSLAQAPLLLVATASTGFEINAKGLPANGCARFRAIWELSRGMTLKERKAVAEALSKLPGLGCVDVAIYTVEHNVFIARPVMPEGMADPIAEPVIHYDGEEGANGRVDVIALMRELAVALSGSPPGGSEEPTDEQEANPERADIATLERLLMGPEAPLRNDKIKDYPTYFDIIQWVHGATGGSEEGLELLVRWAADYPHDPGYDPESKWATITKPFGGANSLWKLAQKIDPTATARLVFDEIPGKRDNLLLSAWLKRDLPPRDYLLGTLMCTTSRWLVFGETGVGKSLLCLDLAAAAAAGKEILGWKGSGKPRRVMYLDGEMPAETFKERMQLIAARYGPDLQLYGYNRDALDEGEMPPLNTPEGEQWLMKEIAEVQPEVIFLNSIMCLLDGVMSEEESWKPVKQLVWKLTARRIAQVWMHHTGHDTSKSFGTKTREWEMDTIVKLTFVDETKTAFTVSFEKARLRTPANAAEFQPRTLSLGPNGWITEPVRGAPGTGRKSDDIVKVTRATVDAYNRLASAVEPTADVDGRKVRKVRTDALRGEVKSRGWLDTKETGGLTGAARMIFLRAKGDLISTGRFIEIDGWFWESAAFLEVEDDSTAY